MITISEALFAEFMKADLFAFRQVYHFYYRPLHYFSMQFRVDEAEGNKLVAEVFYNLLDNIRSGLVIASPAALHELLYRSMRIAIVRQARITAAPSLLDKARYVFTDYKRHRAESRASQEETEALHLLYLAIERMPLQYKRVFKMSYIQERSYQEIAEELGIAVATVRAYRKKAFQLLKDFLLHAPPLVTSGLTAALMALALYLLWPVFFSPFL